MSGDGATGNASRVRSEGRPGVGVGVTANAGCVGARTAKLP